MIDDVSRSIDDTKERMYQPWHPGRDEIQVQRCVERKDVEKGPIENAFLSIMSD
jgi:hypothetical protein